VDAAAAASARTAAITRSIDDTLAKLPRGDRNFVRLVPDEAALRSTFTDLTRGGAPISWKNYAGEVFEVADGTQIGLRSTSGSGGSTIDIRMPGRNPIKIHIG
jgi:hypothetical protein